MDKTISKKLLSPIVVDSLKLLLKKPVLLLPKLVIAVLYGFGTILAVALSKQLFNFQSFTSEQILAYDFSSMLYWVGILFVLAFFTFFIDLIFSGFYPVMVSLFEKNKFSAKSALELFKPKFFPILLSGIIIWVLITGASIIEAIAILYFNLSSTGFMVSFAITFAFIFIFYFLYPKIVFERQGVAKSFAQSFSASMENKRMVFLFSLIPFSVSVIKFALAYFLDSSFVFFLVFWLLVVLTGIIYSLHAVVNQLAYERITKAD